MNFLEVVDEVIGITSRPDKSKEISSAVNAIISMLLAKADFYNDLVETTLAVDGTLYGQSVSLASLTRFKKFKFVKTPGVKGYITPIDPTQILTPKNNIQPNRYYVGGTSLTFTTSTLSPTLEVGYYAYPAILSGTDTHWLLDKSPWCVIDLVAAKIFRSIGDMEAARAYEASGKEAFQTARNDFADGYKAGVQ